MRIVVLDGYTLNPGDLRWDALSVLGEFTVHERTPRSAIVSRSLEAPILLTNKTPLDIDIIAALPALRYIGVLATGYNIVDVRAARSAGITVTNVPSYATMSVVQAVFAHLFMMTHRMGHHTEAVARGRWSDSADFSFRDFPLVEISGQTMGIIGYGRIGRAVADAARAFGMEILASGSATDDTPPPGVRRASLTEVFARSDVLSLHCPLTPATAGLVNRTRLAQMKPTAYLINTSRGGLVDEEALAEALNAGKIAGAGLDVLSKEPPGRDNPLLHAKNCTITPHFAWATVAARTRLLREAAENVSAFLAGKERNIVTA